MSNENNVLKLSDRTIAQVAKVLQLALLSGTDIVDHLRQMRLVSNDNSLDLDNDYVANFETNLERMMEELAQVEPPLEEDETNG